MMNRRALFAAVGGALVLPWLGGKAEANQPLTKTWVTYTYHYEESADLVSHTPMVCDHTTCVDRPRRIGMVIQKKPIRKRLRGALKLVRRWRC